MHYEFEKYRQHVKKRVGTMTLLLLIAEESAELAQAALKYVRTCDPFGDNPTPITQPDAWCAVMEESLDVLMVLDALGITLEDTSYNPKWKRWAERLGYKEDN